MPVSVLPRALTSFFFWDYFLKFVFRETCQYTLVFNIYDGFNQFIFFFKTGCWWESTCIAVSWDNTPKATLLELTGVWQSLGLSVEGGLCGIAWAGCCPLTNPPSFLNTVKFTVLLSNKDRINHNPTGSLLCNTTIQGLLPLSRKCLPDIWISMAEPFPLMEPNDKNLAKAFSCGKP